MYPARGSLVSGSPFRGIIEGPAGRASHLVGIGWSKYGPAVHEAGLDALPLLSLTHYPG